METLQRTPPQETRDLGEIDAPPPPPPQTIGERIVAPLHLQKSPTAQKVYDALKQKAVQVTEYMRPAVKKAVPDPDGTMEKIVAPARRVERVLGIDPEAEYLAKRNEDLDRQIEAAKKALEDSKKRQ